MAEGSPGHGRPLLSIGAIITRCIGELMYRVEKSMVPRRGLRIDLTPRELPFGLIGGSGAVLSLLYDTHPAVVLPLAFLVSIRVIIRLI